MTQHTPGPWVIVGHQIEGPTKDQDGFDRVVAYVHLRQPRNGSAEANARLIAAAPEMLAVLRRLVAVDANPAADSLDVTRVADDARALLAKIEGKG